MAKRPNIQVTTTTPPGIDAMFKTVKVEAIAADAVGFDAFVLPKNAFISGAWVISSVSNATQTINVGTTLGGIQLINAVPTVTTGYAVVGAAAGALMGTQLTADTLFYVKASATLTGQVVVKVEYYIPQQGFDH
jgi:hypothetical protein